MSLLSYQESHAKSLINSIKFFNVCIDSSDTGTGKTYTACYTAKTLGLKPIIVCPKSVIRSWTKVAEFFDLDYYGVSNYESFKNATWYNEKGKKEKCPYVDYDALENEYTLSLPKDCIMIFDEVHRCKNPKTGNAQILLECHKEKAKLLLLSATIADKLEYFSVFAYLTGLCKSVQSYRIFVKGLAMKDPLKSPLKILHEFIYPQYGSRMRISDIGDLFPSNKIIADTYSMGDDVAKEIQKQYELINIVSTDARNKELASNCKLTQMLRAWQRIEVLKIPTMLEMTKDSLESGLSVVIFVNFHDTMNILMEKLGTTCAIHGKQTAKERETNIDNFQSNKESLIICQIKSGGVGISLHDIHGGHPRISLISPSWSAQDLAQALGRIHRANGKTKCIQKIVYCADTVEEDICKAIQDKLDNYARINDGKDESKIKVRIEK